MIKRLPSRSQRSKGIKVKHILQIFLLLGVCFWLIYQIKHSHDKKKEFAENDGKTSAKVQTADEILKLGRKDLHPGKDEIIKNEKHEEEEEDGNVEEDEENKHEHDEQEEEENKHEVGQQGDEENKHKTEEQEVDENRSEETEDGGDDEMDDQEKSEGLTDRDEEFLDEEKEKEEEGDEKENENSEDEEKEAHDENQNTHEAREEHYKGDDASSAVAHDTQTSGTDTQMISSDNSDAKSDTSIREQENKLNYTEESNENQNDSDLRVTGGQFTNGTSLNTTAGEESEIINSSNPSDGSNLNTTMTTSANLTVITDVRDNVTQTGAFTSGSSEKNNMVILSESDHAHAQNATLDAKVTEDIKNVQTEGSEQTSNKVSEEKPSVTNSTVSVGTENVDAAAEASNLGAGELEKTVKSVATNETENNFRDSDVEEKTDATQDTKSEVNNTETDETTETETKSGDSYMKENSDLSEEDKSKDDTQTGGTDGTTNSSSEKETSDATEHDSIDSSDSHFHNDVTEVRTDLVTLPDSRTEGDNGDDIAAE